MASLSLTGHLASGYCLIMVKKNVGCFKRIQMVDCIYNRLFIPCACLIVIHILVIVFIVIDV